MIGELFRRMFGRVKVEGPQERGQRLLKANLTPEQRQQYERDLCFDVIGGSTCCRYRIRHGTILNIDILNQRGDRTGRLCFAPHGDLVCADVMLAQKIALETFEADALSVAVPGTNR